MSVSATSSVSGSNTGTTTTAAPQTLDASTFMQLFTTQLANQDPMNPMDSADFLNQFAQITSIQTLTELQSTLGGLSTQMSSLAAASQLSQAEGLIGRTVGYADQSGASQQGVVEAIQVVPGGGVQLSLTGGTLVGLDAVQQIQ